MKRSASGPMTGVVLNLMLPKSLAALATAILAVLAVAAARSGPEKSGLPGQVGQTAECDTAVAGIRALLTEPADIATVSQALLKEAAALPNLAWLPGYCRALATNLVDKRGSMSEGVTFDAPTLIKTAIGYEAFRITAFRNSGVSPKRFFGFLDARGKTAAYERKLIDISRRVASLLNAYAKKTGLDLTVTPKEIIVTHLAEGGALLLTRNFAEVDTIHPVFGIGLDDYRKGFVHYPGLLEEVDTAFGTRLGVINRDPRAMMTFTESILGTAVMYLYEKEIAEDKLKAEGRASLKGRSLDEQFIAASLVYNSGILFVEERFAMIENFSSGLSRRGFG